MRLKIESGNKIKPEILKELDKIWQLAFTGHYSFSKKSSELGNFLDDKFFILYEKNKILSTGRLRLIESINFKGKDYKIQGISDIVSVEKGKGYGKKIMAAMKKHLDKNRQVGIGFCKKENSEFYKKCGFGIAPGLVRRFSFIEKNGKISQNKLDQDVIFSSRGKRLINDIIKNPKEKILSSKSSW